MGQRRIHIIRHGKTEANLKGLYCGATDVPLSEYGRRELEGYKQSGCYPPGQIFYTSTLRRTAETLDIIYGGAAVERLEAFSEYNFGDFEMKSYDELKDDSRYIEWISDESETVLCPGGESLQLFGRRIGDGFTQIAKQDFSDIVLVTHGGVIASLMAMLFVTDKHFYEWQPKCGLGYSITLNGADATAYAPIKP